jgi:DNA-binding protein HU-beta
MNKAQLVDEIRDAMGGLSKAEGERVLHVVLDVIEGAVLRGEKVVLNGFGVFELKDRAARQGRNPQTGETIQIEAKQVPTAKLTFGKNR